MVIVVEFGLKHISTNASSIFISVFELNLLVLGFISAEIFTSTSVVCILIKNLFIINKCRLFLMCAVFLNLCYVVNEKHIKEKAT